MLTRCFAVILALMLCFTWKVAAFAIPESKVLSDAIDQAQIIVVARLTKYVADPADVTRAEQAKVAHSRVVSFGPDDVLEPTTLKLQGFYTFQVLQVLKGECSPTLELRLPRLFSWYYGYAKLDIKAGSQVLLLLKNNKQGQPMILDFTVPLVPLADNAQVMTDETASVQTQIMHFLTASLTDPALRRANTFLLRKVIDPMYIKGLAPYVDDPDPRTQDSILYYMANNQQVIAIPRIAYLARNNGIESVKGLGHFSTPEAVPYLNPLLFEAGQYVRLNTMFALPKLADQSSIPYLLLALRDPEPQNIVAYTAYRTLRKFNGAAPFVADDNFRQWRGEAIRLMTAWWQDELSGKHKDHATPDAPALPTPKTMPKLDNLTPQQAVPLLNPLLFERSLDTRQQAMTALTKLADQSSIPYLLIALYDPDKGVAYAAYQTLHRLISEVGPAKPQAAFEAQQETELKPLYDWWQDELRGLHTTDTTALIWIAEGDKGNAYKAYRRLHQLVPELGTIKDEATFYAHPKDEIRALQQWQSEQWRKAHPQPVVAPAKP